MKGKQLSRTRSLIICLFLRTAIIAACFMRVGAKLGSFQSILKSNGAQLWSNIYNTHIYNLWNQKKCNIEDNYHKYNIFFLLKASKCDNKIGLMTFVKGFDLHKTTPWHYIFSLVFVCSSDIGYPSLYEKKESLFSANSLSLCHHLLTFYLLYTTNYNSTNTALCLFSITNTIHFEHYCLANFHRRAHFDKF